MNNFYTNVISLGGKILYRGIEDGVRVKKKLEYNPTLFVPSQEETNYKTLSGNSVLPKQFDGIREAKDFIKRYKDVHNFEFYGNTDFHYCYISDNFSDTIDYNFNDLVVANIDIETGSDSGFPEPEDAIEPVIAITMKIKDTFYVFGCGDYVPTEDNIKYIKTENEASLLRKFIDFWCEFEPDIVTGWNIQFFDIPYLVNRIERVLSENDAKQLSPWNFVTTRSVNTSYGKRLNVKSLSGVTILDYLEMYKKFMPTAENNRLDTIAHIELGEKKLDYSEYGSLHNLYKTNFQKFIDYNIKDVVLVDKIDEKLQLMSMVVSVAYDAKVNYIDVFTQVRMWDTIIFNHLKKQKIVVPPKRNKKAVQYAGGYVKQPLPGFYNWVASFDLNSLYPNLIAQFNISPETIVEYKNLNVTVDELLNRSKSIEDLQDDNLTMAANGHFFSRDKQGFLPNILMRMYEDRKIYKKKMIENKKLLQEIEKEKKRRGI